MLQVKQQAAYLNNRKMNKAINALTAFEVFRATNMNMSVSWDVAP
jgi:GR25 family glycosyltransferase involved in LPS biosynthesis